RLTADLFIHTHRVPAAAFGEWAAGEQFQRALLRRLRALGQRRAGRDLLREATAQGWRALAAVDAALRLTAALVRPRGLARGAGATPPRGAVWPAAAAGDPELTPQAFGFAGRAVADGGAVVDPRGVVLVRATGRQPPATAADLPPELTAAVREPRPRPV